MALTPEGSHVVRGTGRGTRIGIAAQVALTLVLALAATLLVDWLSQQPALRLRKDMTRGQENTLSAPTLQVLELLPVDVTIDVFFQGRALERPLEAVGLEVQEHTRRVVRLLSEASHGRITVEGHDLSDRSGTSTSAMSRLRELNIREVEPGGLVVVSAGTNHQVLHLRGDLSDIDPGVPGGQGQEGRAPRVIALRAEEALVSALHKVASQTKPKTLFSVGHGELDPDGTDPGGAALFRRDLEADGFEVARWNIEKDGAIPAACQIFFVLGPEQPFSPAEEQELVTFVESGGRLVLTPPDKTNFDGAGSVPALAAHFGVQVTMRGLIARKIPQANGDALDGVEQCAYTVIWSDGMAAQNPVTETLRRAGRRVYLPFSRIVQRANTFPPGANMIPLLRTDGDSWFDLADPTQKDAHDWLRRENEELGPFVVAIEALFPTPRPVPAERATSGGRPETRVCCIGSTAAFANWVSASNRDFLLNVCNWISSREYRVNVKPKSTEARRLEPTQQGALSTIQLFAVIVLPGACLLLGLFTAWRRRS